MRVGWAGEEVEESAESLLSGSTALGGAELSGVEAEIQLGTLDTGVLGEECGVVGVMHVATVWSGLLPAVGSAQEDAVGSAQDVAFSGEGGEGSVWVGELLGGDFWGEDRLGDSGGQVGRSLGDAARAGDTAGDSARPGSLDVRVMRLLLPLYLPGIDLGAAGGQEQGRSSCPLGAAESSPEHRQ